MNAFTLLLTIACNCAGKDQDTAKAEPTAQVSEDTEEEDTTVSESAE